MIETITAQQAEAYAQTIAHRAPPDEGRIRQYAEAMKRGEWEVRPDSPVTITEGVLVNGRHRMLALARTGMTLQFYVERRP